MRSQTEHPPEFTSVRKVLLQEFPGLVLVSARAPDGFVHYIRGVLDEGLGLGGDGAGAGDPDSVVYGSAVLETKPSKDFIYESCLTRLTHLKIDGKSPYSCVD